MRRTAGQSTVEVIGLLPLLLAVGLGVFALLSAGAAREAASGAAEAGAVALLQGRDARAAARAALPGWPRGGARVSVAGRRVTVAVTPSGPFGARLRASVSADAGFVTPVDLAALRRAIGLPGADARSGARRRRAMSGLARARGLGLHRRSPSAVARAAALRVARAGPRAARDAVPGRGRARRRAARAGAGRRRAAHRLAGRGAAARRRSARRPRRGSSPGCRRAGSRRSRGGGSPGSARATPTSPSPRRALAAVDVPAVVAITGPRSAATDELLAEQDQLVLVVPTDEDARLDRARPARACGIRRSAHRPRPAPLPAPARPPSRAGPAEVPVSRLRAGWGAALRDRGRRRASGSASERGQASIARSSAGSWRSSLGALVLGLVARGGGREARAQRAADLGALAARAGDARRVRAAVRAGVRRPRAGRARATSARRSTSRSAARRRCASRGPTARAACAWRFPDGATRSRPSASA